MNERWTPEDAQAYFENYYAGEKMVRVLPFGTDAEAGGALFSDALAGRNYMEVFVSGNAERMVVASRFDNLGKGASGAAIQCMNIVLGEDETTGLAV